MNFRDRKAHAEKLRDRARNGDVELRDTVRIHCNAGGGAGPDVGTLRDHSCRFPDCPCVDDPCDA